MAVVRRNSNVTIDTLKGVRSCHTGINRTAGWNVPVGYLVESGHLSVMGCDVLKGEHQLEGPGPAPSFFPLSAQVALSPHVPWDAARPPPAGASLADSSQGCMPTPGGLHSWPLGYYRAGLMLARSIVAQATQPGTGLSHSCGKRTKERSS